MSFDPAWDELHERKPWGQYPSEHLMRFVKRTQWLTERKIALDLGCGAGAQSRFLEGEGFVVHAVDGSREAIRKFACDLLHAADRRRAVITEVSDIVTMRPMPKGYDLVVDVCTLQHLSVDDATKVIRNVHKWLKSGGWFFSLMASDKFVLDCKMQPRLANYEQVMKLCDIFFSINLGHETVDRPDGGTVAHWIIEARKD